MKLKSLTFALLLLRVTCPVGLGAVHVVSERNDDAAATGAFRFKDVPPPARQDAAEKAVFTLVDGERDPNGGDLGKLHDGQLPKEGDQPAENFFFRAGTAGGRVQVDLGSSLVLRQVNTYSWHPGNRSPQVYRLYASDGSAPVFKAEPKRESDPEAYGWRLLATVDTRPKDGTGGGQEAVSVRDSAGNLGTYRYLLFDISRTESEDPFGETFFSEIDVVEAGATPLPVAAEEAKRITQSFVAEGGKYHFTIDTTIAPDLTEWADHDLRPVVQEWYPRLVALLPSEGFMPRTNVTLRFRDDMAGTPASAGGGVVNCNAGWFRGELKREARGSVVHEMVHVVQNYRGGRRSDTNVTRMPGWLVEGIPDYIRWYLYEPQTRGAEITARNVGRAKYDGSYRITANFLNWVSTQYDPAIVQKLNAAGRAGKYREELWKEATGKTVQELGAEWKLANEQRLATPEK
ncbi:MAG TPA: basic secretory protein-like protein [Candidatus Limnocylindria bacterium]|nr:basic secretory protein-like protein [Candidatus Limnocylindria bacterium]